MKSHGTTFFGDNSQSNYCYMKYDWLGNALHCKLSVKKFVSHRLRGNSGSRRAEVFIRVRRHCQSGLQAITRVLTQIRQMQGKQSDTDRILLCKCPRCALNYSMMPPMLSYRVRAIRYVRRYQCIHLYFFHRWSGNKVLWLLSC